MGKIVKTDLNGKKPFKSTNMSLISQKNHYSKHLCFMVGGLLELDHNI